MIINRQKTAGAAALLAILIIAAYLRLSNLDAIEFKADEARGTIKALNIVHGTELPLVGGMLWGFQAGPYSYYILAIPAFFTSDPRLITGFLGLLNIFAVYMCFRIGHDFFSPRVGYISAALYAVSPWAVLFSRKIWGADFQAPLVTVFFYFLLMWAVRRKSIYFPIAVASLVFALQVHFFPLPFVFVFFIIWATLRPPISARSILVSAVVSLLIVAPYLYNEYNLSFKNIRAMTGSHSSFQSSNPNYAQSVLSLAWSVSAGSSLRGNLGDIWDKTGYSPWVVYAISLLLLLAVPYAAISAFTLSRGTLTPILKAKPQTLIILLWFLAPPITLILREGSLFPHYLSGIFPSMFLLIGILLDFAATRFKKYHGEKIIATAIILLVAYQAHTMTNILKAISENGGATADYGPTLKSQMDAVSYMIQYSQGRPFTMKSLNNPSQYPFGMQYLFQWYGITQHANDTKSSINYLILYPKSKSYVQYEVLPHSDFGLITVYVEDNA
ncbi:Uncharacterised protein [Candidatus Burarchaeum australiense]|nr:Uncharacterised protein [Candidatus Burarchaeum australiense]